MSNFHHTKTTKDRSYCQNGSDIILAKHDSPGPSVSLCKFFHHHALQSYFDQGEDYSYLRPVADIDAHWRIIIQQVHRTPLVAKNLNCATKRTVLLSPFSYEGHPHRWLVDIHFPDPEQPIIRCHRMSPSSNTLVDFSESFSSSNVNASSVSTGAILDPHRCHFHKSLLVACELTPFVVLFPFKAYNLLPSHYSTWWSCTTERVFIVHIDINLVGVEGLCQRSSPHISISSPTHILPLPYYPLPYYLLPHCPPPTLHCFWLHLIETQPQLCSLIEICFFSSCLCCDEQLSLCWLETLLRSSFSFHVFIWNQPHLCSLIKTCVFCFSLYCN